MSEENKNKEFSFFGSSQMGSLAQSINWSHHPLGPVLSWPNELKTAISIIFGSKFPMFISWGRERYFFYNDAYAVILGKKHPQALGNTFKNIWIEIWSDIEPLILSVDRGEAVYLEDLKLIMNRYGSDEETYFTFSYSPIISNAGENIGLYCAVVETTARKKAEENLKAEQFKLMNVFSQAPNPIALLEGPEHRFTFANDMYIKRILQGRNPVGKPVLEIVPEAKFQGFLELLDHVYQTGERYIGNENEFYTESETGRKELFYLNFVYEPIRNAQGLVTGVLAVIFDVTGLVQARDKAINSEARLQTLAATIPQIAWRTDVQGLATYFNLNWMMKTGKELEDSLGDKWIEVIHPEDRESTLTQWKKALAGEEEYHVEYRIRMADGSYRWHLARAVPVLNKSGHILEWIGAATDIDDQKRAKLEYERSVDVSPAILWITGQDGSCSYLSKQWFEFTGQTEEEALGYGWLEMTHPDDKKRTHDIYKTANDSQKPFYAEYRLKTKDGSYRWAIDAGNPRYDHNGNYLGYAGSVFDIHDLKTYEVELREALRSRDEFLSIASHELKTPLTSLKIQSQLQQRLLKRKDPRVYSEENITEIVQLMDKQVSKLSRLVDDMLDVARIRSGHLRIQREEFDMHTLVLEVMDRLKGQFEDSRSPIPVTIVEGDVKGCWDRLRIEQVVINLLTNALRYGNKKEVEVRILDKKESVCLEVLDHGIGISEGSKIRIFDRFERSINSNEVSGLGLGLFITKQIVLSHQGKVWVESELGKGSCFYVELPKKDQSQGKIE
jgi:PAS domain S-box-containing protein